MPGGRARAGHGPEAGNRLIILPESRRREPNALMVEPMKPEKEGGSREGVCHLGQAYLSCGKKSRSARASLHSSSHFSLKREGRGGGIRVIEARNLTTAGGRKERRRESGPIASPSSSSSFRRSLRRSKVIIEGETRHEGGLALSRARSRCASEIGRRRERDGRARYLPEQKPIDRSDDRLFYLRPAAFLFSDIRITIFRVGHFPLATCSLFP